MIKWFLPLIFKFSTSILRQEICEPKFTSDAFTYVTDRQTDQRNNYGNIWNGAEI